MTPAPSGPRGPGEQGRGEVATNIAADALDAAADACGGGAFNGGRFEGYEYPREWLRARAANLREQSPPPAAPVRTDEQEAARRDLLRLLMVRTSSAEKADAIIAAGWASPAAVAAKDADRQRALRCGPECTGCGATVGRCILIVADGKIKCCPDCHHPDRAALAMARADALAPILDLLPRIKELAAFDQEAGRDAVALFQVHDHLEAAARSTEATT